MAAMEVREGGHAPAVAEGRWKAMALWQTRNSGGDGIGGDGCVTADA